MVKDRASKLANEEQKQIEAIQRNKIPIIDSRGSDAII